MVARHGMLAVLGIGSMSLLLGGCAELAPRRLDKLGEGPPVPAAPLAIVDPPRASIPAPSSVVVAAAQNAPAPVLPAAAPAPASDAALAATLRALYQKAAQQYQAMDSYIMRLRRREVVRGKSRPEELLLVKFRQNPWSVYFKWIGPEAKGREVVYVKGRPGNEIHTLTAAGDILLLPGGSRFSISADSALVKSKSRYPITEAGLGSTIRKFGVIVEAVEKGDPRQGKVKYLGRVKRPEFEAMVEGVEQVFPPGCDPLQPAGGRRWWYFDTKLGLPALIITHDETSREVEYYCHDRIQGPARLDDDDFNPDKLWQKKPE